MGEKGKIVRVNEKEKRGCKKICYYVSKIKKYYRKEQLVSDLGK